MYTLRVSVIALGAALVLSSCASEPPEATDQPSSDDTAVTAELAPEHTIVATTNILGSVVGSIAECVGDGSIAVQTLMPIGTDPHDFQASSEQLALMAESGIVVANGLHLEESLDDVLDQLVADGHTVLRVAEAVDPLPFAEKDADTHDDHAHDDHAQEEEADEHGHGEFDPHFWLDMNRVALVADLLGEQLGEQLGEDFVRCAGEVASSIRNTEAEVVAVLSTIPDADRVLVTDHDAFGYFAERYDFEVAGVVIPGGSTLAEPSSQELAALVATIQERGVRAIFGNYYVPSDLLQAVAEESGGAIDVVPLYVGSVGEPGGDADDYEAMMLTNARLVAAALGS